MLLNLSFCFMQTWCMVGLGQNSTLPRQWAFLFCQESFLSGHFLLWVEPRIDGDVGSLHA